MTAVEFVTTKQGAISMLYEGYKYTLNRHGNTGQTYWRCVNRSCPGRMTLDIQDRAQSVNEKHFHQPN